MNKLVVSLFDLTGAALRPWFEAGYQVLQIDLQLPEGLEEVEFGWYRYGGDCIFAIEVIERVKAIHGSEVVFISCFPPCTDLAVSGSRWFESKGKENPLFQEEAMKLVYLSRDVIEHYDVAGYIENPVSVISSKWRKPDFIFHPYFFTNICIEDNYTKKTCLWTSEQFEMPENDIHPNVQKAIDDVVRVYGRFVPKPQLFKQVEKKKHKGKFIRSIHVYAEEMLFSTEELLVLEQWYPDDRIHKAGPGIERANFRSATPVGWSKAVFEVNRL